MGTANLLCLKDTVKNEVEYLDLSEGVIYADEGGLHKKCKIYETDVVLDGDGKAVRSEGQVIHRAQLSDGAAEFYARKRVEQTGRRERVKGRLIQMDLAPSDVHTDATLPNYAGGYRITEGVADVASPVMMVPKASDVFYTWNQNTDFQRVMPNATGEGGDVAEWNPSLSASSYQVVEYAFGGFMPVEVISNADAPLQPFLKMTQVLVDKARLEREIRVAAILQAAGNWNTGNVNTLIAGAQWNGGAGGDPVKNLHNAIEASYLPVTGIIWSELVEHDFIRNPQVQKYFTFKDSVDGIPDPAKISSTLRLPPISTAMMKYVTGGNLTYVWGNHVVLVHGTGDLASQMDVATSRTFRWNGTDGGSKTSVPDGTMSAGFLVRTYYDPTRGARGGNRVVVVHSDIELMTSGFVGGLILNAHQ